MLVKSVVLAGMLLDKLPLYNNKTFPNCARAALLVYNIFMATQMWLILQRMNE